ncbi:hypothetical protein [Helicobacter sp. T3_23-1059]
MLQNLNTTKLQSFQKGFYLYNYHALKSILHSRFHTKSKRILSKF